MAQLVKDRYRIERLLGEGAAGKVYLVSDRRREGRRLALKLLLTPGARHLELLRHEFSVLTALRHPNLAQVHDFGYDEERGSWFYTSEYIRGREITSACKRRNVRYICSLFAQVLRALQYIHSYGIIHYDIKPGNILVGPDGVARLIDFGLAARQAPFAPAMRGTVGYAAPEVVRGEQADRRADLYSLGIVLYEALAGRRPFEGSSAIAVLREQAQREPQAPSKFRRRIPPFLEQALMRLLEREPAGRFQSANEVIRSISQATGISLDEETAETARAYLLSGGFVGRKEELQKLTALVDALGSPAAGPHLLFITGGLGAGKSRLLREVCYHAQLSGVNVVRSSCGASRSRPFGPFADAVNAARPVRPLKGSDGDAGGAEPGERGRIVHETAEVMIEGSRARPVLVAVDDLEEGDDDTLALLEHAARLLYLRAQEGENSSLLLLCACNVQAAGSGMAGALIERLTSAGLAGEIALAPLSEEAQRRLLSAMLGGVELPRKVRRAVMDAAGGNPLVIEQMLESLLQSGVLFYEAGRWHASAALAELRPPGGGEEVLKQRIKTLLRDERAVVQALGCIGRPAEFELLCAVADIQPAVCAGAVDRLVQRRLVRSDGEGRYSFTSGRMVEVVTGTIAPKRRRAMHRRAYSHLEGTKASLIELALQGDLAELDEEILLPILWGAAGRAEKTAATSSAIKLYKAIQRRTSPEAEDWFKALDRLAVFYRRTEEVEKILGYARAVKPDSLWQYPEVGARIVSKFIDAYLRSGKVDEAEHLVRAALTRLKGGQFGLQRAKMLAASARVAEFRGKMEEAQRLLLEARPMAQSGGDSEEVNSIDYWLARVEFRCGRYEEAAGRARAMLKRRSAASYRGGLHNLLGVIYRTAGKLKKALEQYNLSLKVWEKAGNLHGTAMAHDNIASVYFDSDEYEKALDAHTPGKRLMQVFGDRVSYGGSLINIGNDHFALGHVRKALVSYEEALEIGEESSNSVLKLYSLASRAIAYATLGRTEAALSDYGQALQLAQKTNTEHIEGVALHERAYVLAYLCGDFDAARRDLSRACSILPTSASGDLADALVLSAELSALVREADKALQALKRAQSLVLSGSVLKRVKVAKVKMLLSEGKAGRAAKLIASLEKERLSVMGRVKVALLRAKYEFLSSDMARGMEHAVKALKLARQAGNVVLVFEAAQAAGECAAAAGDYRQAVKYIAQTEEMFDRIASALPEKYSRKHLRSSPFYSPLDELKGRLKILESKETQPAGGEDLTVGREALEAAGVDERLLVRDGLALLGMVTRLASVELEVQKVLSLSLSMVLDVTRAERGFILLVDESGNLRNIAARDVLDEEITSPEYRTSHTMVREVIKTGKPYIVSDATLDKLLQNAKSVIDLGLRSVLCVPILHEERVIGVVYLDTTSLAGALSEADLILVEEFVRRIAPVILRAIEQERARRRLRSLEEEVQTRYAYTNIVGRSKPMREMFGILDSVSDTDITVYIYGETGTGKELVAKALHYNSHRKDEQFISINCAALPEPLLESELFGYVKGAFTGADADKPGLIEAAGEGTLFLDEIGNMPLGMQAKLLRVIEEQQVRRVGSTLAKPVDVRVVCASNTPLERLVEEEKFREDLFYRLNVVRIELPALREKREDIGLLAEHFMKEFARELKTAQKPIDSDAITRLCAYNYPGNVRQLRNIIQQVFLTSGERITVEKTEAVLRSQEQEPEPQTAVARELSIEEYIREFVLANQGRYSETELAKKLGITRTNLWQKRKKLRIPRPK